MSTYLVIDQNNVVVNNIEWDGESDHALGHGLRLVAHDGPAGAGWKWDDATATAADPNPPSSLKPRGPPSMVARIAAELVMTPEALIAKLTG